MTTETERLIRQFYEEDAREKRRRGRDHSARTVRPDGSMGSLDFLREVVFGTPIEKANADAPQTLQHSLKQLPKDPLTAQCGFSVHCFLTPEGKILRKEEVTPLGPIRWEYEYDAKGHLHTVTRNGTVVERYCYDMQGRRYLDHRTGCGYESRELVYDTGGRLVQVNDMTMAWDARGTLRDKSRNGRTLRFSYGEDTRLGSVRLLPGVQEVTYEYGEGLMPTGVFLDGQPVLEYEWLHDDGALYRDVIPGGELNGPSMLPRLSRCRDLRNGTEYEFHYAADDEESLGNMPLHRAPAAVTLRGPLVERPLGSPRSIPGTRPHAFERPFAPGLLSPGMQGDSIRLLVFTDQAESIRLLAREGGTTVLYVEYDSFGNVTRNTLPELWFPLGFACGLNDPFTGFVRFGFRDYDPEVGRFTAKDSLGDTGGDHDLWDYCVDDPVSRNDPMGLFAPFIVNQIRQQVYKTVLKPTIGNCPEIAGDIERLEEKIRNGTATEKDLSILEYQKKKLKECEDQRK